MTNLYAIGVKILSDGITFKKKTMFTKLNEILKEGDTAKLVVTKTKTGMAVTILPVLKEDAEVKLVPISATGSPEELDAQLIEEFGKTLPEVRQTIIDTKTIVEQVKAKKAEEEKKLKDSKKAKDDKKTAPKVKGTVETPDKDDDDDDDDVTDEPEAKEEKAPAAPAEPPKPKYTTEQKKAISQAEELYQRALKSNDEDMVNYLQKNALLQLSKADINTKEYVAKFAQRIDQILSQTQPA